MTSEEVERMKERADELGVPWFTTKHDMTVFVFPEATKKGPNIIGETGIKIFDSIGNEIKYGDEKIEMIGRTRRLRNNEPEMIRAAMDYHFTEEKVPRDAEEKKRVEEVKRRVGERLDTASVEYTINVAGMEVTIETERNRFNGKLIYKGVTAEEGGKIYLSLDAIPVDRLRKLQKEVEAATSIPSEVKKDLIKDLNATIKRLEAVEKKAARTPQ